MKMLNWRAWLLVVVLVGGLCFGALGLGGWAAAQVVSSALPEVANAPSGDLAHSNQGVILGGRTTIQVDRPAERGLLQRMLHELAGLLARIPGLPAALQDPASGAQRFLTPAAPAGSLSLDASEAAANEWVSLQPAPVAGDQVVAGPGAPAAAGLQPVDLRLRREMRSIEGVTLQ